MKEGDVVQLKSGGPLMTISSVNNNASCSCIWFTDSVSTRETFPTITLEKK
ncbi:MAG: DUF2158 domain-containing protein [Sulfuricurvum sp.]|nr:DUF2158 domain-containing protein [Sulfuricurvum sp.]